MDIHHKPNFVQILTDDQGWGALNFAEGPDWWKREEDQRAAMPFE